MKILVAYFSQTGNTEKIAKAIHAEVSGTHTTDLRKIDEVDPEKAQSYDLIFLGSPCHAGDLSAPARSFLDGISGPSHLKLAGFVTHASAAYEKEGFEKCITTFDTSSKAKGITFLGSFDCQGYLSPDIQSYVKKAKKVSDEKWEQTIKEMTGKPDKHDEEDARIFARAILDRT
jgi:flavodoxin I